MNFRYLAALNQGTGEIVTGDQCDRCGWALCQHCQNVPCVWHSNAECDSLAKLEHLYEAIFPVRLLCFAQENGDIWAKQRLDETVKLICGSGSSESALAASMSATEHVKVSGDTSAPLPD